MITNVVAAELPTLPLGYSIVSGILGVVILGCALGVAFSRRAVHAAVYMVGVMLSLAIIYIAEGAEFLGAVQIVVYTGAIMMLFLFVIMLVGVQSIDSPRDTKAGLVAAVILLAIAFAVVAILAVFNTDLVAGGQALSGSNPVNVATSLINNHYFSMELVATLLIIAAVGAMTLTHSDRLLPRVTQRFVVEQRMKAYKEKGTHPGQLPPPGVYATSNALDVPAISGETGEPVLESVPRVVRVRGEARSLGEAAPWAAYVLGQSKLGKPGLFGAEATATLTQSGSWGMPGPSAPEVPDLSAGDANPPALEAAAEEGENK